jgi:RNA polymerase sigma-70 factor (sigma-E family)
MQRERRTRLSHADDTEYREFVLSRLDRLRRTAYLLCRDWHTADDLVSDTLTRLYRHWGRARQAQSLDAYVRTILTRAWLDERRRPWRREEVTDCPPDRGTEPVLTGFSDRADLAALLTALPRRQRAVVVLRFYCDLSVAETAELLGVSEGTVKSQSARGLEILRAAAPDHVLGERP